MLDEAVALGCSILGWRARTVGYCERDAYAAACLLARMEEQSVEPAPVWAGDMADFDARPFRGVVDILAAGLPCQPYSCAGSQRGLDDHRSYGDGSGPIPHALRIIAECRPALVFLENVPPWVRGGWFRPVGEELCRLGYTLEQPLFVTAESVGASHRRERVFVLAYANDVCQPPERFAWGASQEYAQHRSGGGGVANSDRARPHESAAIGSDGPRAARAAPGSTMANASGPRQQERPGIDGDAGTEFEAIERVGRVGLFAPGPNADWRDIPEFLWPAVKPGFRLLVDGRSVVLDESRADQLRCIGNSVVATAGAVAFVELVRGMKKAKVKK